MAKGPQCGRGKSALAPATYSSKQRFPSAALDKKNNRLDKENDRLDKENDKLDKENDRPNQTTGREVVLGIVGGLDDPHFLGNYSNVARPEDVDAALGRTDAVIKRFEEHQRMLRGHRNTLVHISRLPVELLQEIFRCVVDMEYLKGQHCYRATSFAFSQVCRQWRKIALKDPFIWRRLSTHDSLGITMLERSKGANLVVHADCTTKKTSHKLVVDVLKMHAKVLALDLHASAKKLENLVKLISSPMAVAMSVSLSSSNGPARLICPGLDKKVAPCLQELSLNRCLLPANSKAFLELSRLELIAFDSDNLRFDIATLVSVLSQSPQLGTLVLHNAIAEEASKTRNVHSSKKLTMTSLHTLDIWNDVSGTVGLLRRLNLPIVRSLILKSIDCKSLAQAHALIDHVLTWSSTEVHLGPLSSFTCGESWPLEISCAYGREGDDKALVQLLLFFTESGRDKVLALRHLLHKLPLQDLETLTMEDTEAEISWPIWERVRALPSLKTVHLFGRTVVTLLQMLEASLASPTGPLPFPALQSLSMSSVDMTPVHPKSQKSLLQRLGLVLKAMKYERKTMPQVVLSRGLANEADPEKLFEDLGLEVQVNDFC